MKAPLSRLLHSPQLDFMLQQQLARWNAVVGKRAVRTDPLPDGSGFKVLHPTKGWRYVSNRRLGY